MAKGTDIVDADHVETQQLALLRMENETIMAAARMQPRDPVKIVAELQALIDAYPAAADEAIYSKPVGTVLEVTCLACNIHFEAPKITKDLECPACGGTKFGDRPKKIKKFAENLSIRAAESIRSIFGYTRLATTTEIMSDGRAKLTGVLVDYGAGNLTSDERIVSPLYKSAEGPMRSMSEDRFLNVAVKAEKSKLKRDIILDSVPNIVKAKFFDACQKKLVELISPEIVAQKIVPAFAQFGINGAHLDQIMGSPAALGWTQDQRLELKKILTALKSGETTARELLEDLVDKPAATPAENKKAPVTMDDLMGKSTAPETPQQEQNLEPLIPTPENSAIMYLAEHEPLPRHRPPSRPPEDDKGVDEALGPADPEPPQQEPPKEEKKPAPKEEKRKGPRAQPPSDPLAELFQEAFKVWKKSADLKANWDLVAGEYDRSGGDIEAARKKLEELKG